MPDGRFDADPGGLPYLRYSEQGTFKSYSAEDLVKEFYDPQAVRASLTKHTI